MKHFIILFCICMCCACGSVLRVTERATDTGRFPTHKTAKTTISINAPRSAVKKLVVVPDETYLIEMTKNLNFFEEVQNWNEFEAEIIKHNLQDSVPSLNSLIEISKAARHYKPFYVLYCNRDKKDNKWYYQMRLLEAKSGTDIFACEIYLNIWWDAYTDKGTFYPLFNSLLDYLNGLQ